MNKVKLRLSEILEVDNRNVLEKANNDNVFIIADVGCGKTYFTINTLCRQVDDALILVDNNALKEQIMKTDEQICDSKRMHFKQIEKNGKIIYELRPFKGFGRPIMVMTYSEFGMRVKYDIETEFLESFDLIVCDEIHNLINYQSFDDSANLLVAFLQLIKKYEHTKIVWLTATPYYLQVLEDMNPKLSKHFIFYDYTKDKRLMRYVNNSESYLQHLESIPTELEKYKDYFNYNDGKVLIFTQKIANMKIIYDLVNKLDFIRPICVWSENNKNNKMEPDQIAVKTYLIENKTLIEPFNCLIINSAYETGINIEDELMNICICHTTNITQQVQARGRIRHDINLLVVRSDDRKKTIDSFDIDVSDDMLDKWLTKEELQSYLDNLNIPTDRNNRKFTVNTFVNNASQYGYAVEKKKKGKNQKIKYYINKL